MEQVLVYGLGKVFLENREKILQEYNVVAYCDADESKLETIKIGGGGYLVII